jgi:NADH-quinone oxidoreductase subunit J
VIQAAIFYLFAFVVCASALMVIVARNPVHSVLWLILAFFNAAGLFLVIGAEFLAMILVIVYVGAVAVLFLFVVMMLDIDFTRMRAGFARYLPFGLLVGLILLVELILVGALWSFGDIAVEQRAAPAEGRALLTNTEAIGTILYTDYVFAFQLAGMILLTAMIGAIVLTLRQRPGVRRQSIADQTARGPETAIRNTRPAVGAGVDTSGGVR